MLGSCDRDGCVIAVVTSSANAGWAIREPAWSKIMTVPCRPGRCACTKSLKLSSLRSAATTPGTFPRSGALTVITGAPMLKERYGAETYGRSELMVCQYQDRLRAS